MDDEIKAQRLAAWLSSPAGTAPPEDLDPEVLGAVWALAPDRAPVPRVSIDDIFSLVTEGPFAPGAGVTPSVVAVTSGEVVRFPGIVGEEASGEWDADDRTHVTPTGPARLVAHPGGKGEAPGIVAPAPPLARRRPSRAWMAPTLGLALAAAAATLIVVPTMGKLSPAGLVEQEEAREANLASPPPPPSVIAEVPTKAGPAVSVGPADEGAVAQEKGSAESDVLAGAAPRAEAQLRKEPAGSAGLESGAARGDASSRGFGQPSLGALPDIKENEGPSIASTSSSSTASTTGSVGRSRDADAPGAAEEAPTAASTPAAAAPSTPAPARSQSASAPSDPSSKTYIPEAAGPSAPREAADDSLLDGAVEEQAEAVRASTASRAETAKKDRAPGAGAPKPAAKASAAYESDDAPSPSAPAPGQSAPSQSVPSPSAPDAVAGNVVTASARASAWPNDYDAGWYRALADVAPPFDAARADEAAGRFDAALDRYRTLTADGRPAVAQDASLRAAKALRALGRNAEALATVDDGLNRSGVNTPFRASLFALRGDLLVLVGRAGEAEAAWASAATLNAAR